MGKISKEIAYLTKEEIITINHYMVLKHGGRYEHHVQNILNPSALDYLLEVVQTEIFGEHLFKTIFEKAAAYAHHIIKDHIFVEGNKRTGPEAALIFLKNNGIKLKEKITDIDIERIAEDLACDHITLTDFSEWLKENSTRLRKSF